MSRGLLRNIPFWAPLASKYFLYVLFSYKNIMSYCLIQEYSTKIFERDKSIVIRDIFTIPTQRKKRYASIMLKAIALECKKKIDDLWFSRPVSEGLKRTLKSLGCKDIKTIQGENHNSRSIEKL